MCSGASVYDPVSNDGENASNDDRELGTIVIQNPCEYEWVD